MVNIPVDPAPTAAVSPVPVDKLKGLPSTLNSSSLVSDLNRIEVVLVIAGVTIPQVVSLLDVAGLSHGWAAGMSAAVASIFVIVEGIKDAINGVKS